MNFTKLLIGAAAVLSLAACSKSNDNKATSGSAQVSAPASVNAADTYVAGTPNYTFSVASGTLSADGVAINKIDDTTFAGYPMLASQVADLSTTNKVIETKENSLELWNSDSLILAFDLRSGAPTLLHSRSGTFAIDSATWAMSAQDKGQSQGLSTGDLVINMHECQVAQQQDQGKGQGQDQGKVAPIDQGKGQGQDQGKAMPAPINQGKDQGKPSDQGQNQGKKFLGSDLVVGGPSDQGQGQNQGKEEGKPAQQCKAVVMTFHVVEIAQPKQDQGKDQGQDQGKGKDQGQDQGKVAPAPAPIDQGKDQGKGTPAPIDQGKGQGQDQGKVAPAPAPIDQGKDQGKGTPAPIDQGKGQGQGQDQGKVAPAPAPIDQGQNQGKDQGKK